jgi:outer membrane cobalamin receptor
MKISSLLISALLIVFAMQSKGQTMYSFQAIIRDSLTHETLVGASMIQQGTSKGARSDADGRISMQLAEKGLLKFSVRSIGYVNKEINIMLPQSDSVTTIWLLPNEQELEAVTISSVRTNSRIEDIPTRIEVLGLDDMKEENGIKPGNIMSLLGDIAGIQMQQVSASSGNTFARIQGLNGRYTQLLKDGMPLFGGLSGSFSILQIPPLDLKQIEIIKGSVSTLYGGDAIGGIINLVSKDASVEPTMSVTTNVTSLRECNLNAYYSRRSKRVGFTLFAGQTLQQQGDIDKDGLSDVPNVHSTVIHPKLIFYLSPRSTITLNYTTTLDRRQGGDMHYFSKTTNDTLYHIDNHVQRNNADAKWFYELSKTRNLTIKLCGSFLNQHLDTKAYTFNAMQRIYYSEISYVQKMKYMDWVGGINVNGDKFVNESIRLGVPRVSDYNYQTTGVFIQNTWKPFAKLTVETGLRGDYHSTFGFFPLPRLSLMYKFNKPFTARINGGFGYKIPNVITYTNPEIDLNRIAADITLKPELSKGMNADLNFTKMLFGKLNVTLNQSFFYTVISQPVFDSSTTVNKVSLANASKVLQTRGLQTYARIRYRSVELYAGYVFTDVRKLYDPIHTSMIVTPKHNLSATFFYEHNERWRIGLESSYIAQQLDQYYKPVSNYVLLAAMIQYNVGKLTFVLNGENLGDVRQSKYEKIVDGAVANPTYRALWAPIDGRVVNFSVRLSL